MANRNIVDVLTEYEDGQLIYSCTFNGKHKLAKYVGMKLWLKENGAPDGMIQMLEGLFWLLELSEVEKAFRLNDLVIISLMKSHVSQKEVFSSIKFDFFIFQRWFEGVRSYMQAKRSSNQDKYPRGNMK